MVHGIYTIRFILWLSWVFATQERKKESGFDAKKDRK